MALEAGRLSLFGLDLRRGLLSFREGWSEALEWPLLAWLSPVAPVQAIFPDGSERLLEGASSRPSPARAKPESVALVLPDELVLSHRLVLPNLVRAELREALRLEVDALSPFPEADTVWGARIERSDDGRRPVVLAISSRSRIEATWNTAPAGDDARAVEVWAWADGPVVFGGYGEARRERSQFRRRILVVSAVAAVVAMAYVLALAPFMAMRQQVFDAQRQVAGLQSETVELLKAREAAVSGGARLQAIRARIGERVALLPMLDELARLLPDDVYLTRVDMRSGRVTIAGLASNAAALMEKISSAPQFVGVRAPAPIAKASSGKESFTIEFTYAEGSRG